MRHVHRSGQAWPDLRDSHERTTLPNWPRYEIVFAITPQLGARFTQFFADMPTGATGSQPLKGIQRFFFVFAGKVELLVDGKVHEMEEETYAFLPADHDHQIKAVRTSRIIVLEKPYVELVCVEFPGVAVALVADVPRSAMKGDERLMLQKLLPAGSNFDCEVNIMDFALVASLPYVETHFMEHGLLSSMEAASIGSIAPGVQWMRATSFGWGRFPHNGSVRSANQTRAT